MFFRCVAVVILLLATELSDAAERRPNILFIVTDDQSPETLRVYGNTLCETPNIDRLGYEGMVFDDAHHMGVLGWCGVYSITHHDHDRKNLVEYSRRSWSGYQVS